MNWLRLWVTDIYSLFYIYRVFFFYNQKSLRIKDWINRSVNISSKKGLPSFDHCARVLCEMLIFGEAGDFILKIFFCLIFFLCLSLSLFSFPSALLLSRTSLPYILHCLVFYHKSSFFILYKFYWCIFRLTELFSSHFQSYVKPIHWSSIPIFYLLVIYVFQAIYLTHFYNFHFILYFSFLL